MSPRRTPRRSSSLRQVGAAALDRRVRQAGARRARNEGTLGAPREVPPPLEFIEQRDLMRKIRAQRPDLWHYVHATPNGTYASKASAGKAKAEGVRTGYPDWSLDLARGPFLGFRCEMKRRKRSLGAVSSDQRVWGHRLNAAGFLTVVGYGAQHALEQLLAYDALGPYEQNADFDLELFQVLSPSNYPL